MIKVTRLNGQKIVVNADLIEFIEEIPDTIISLTTGKKIMVRENSEEIIDRAVAYRRATHHGPPPTVLREGERV